MLLYSVHICLVRCYLLHVLVVYLDEVIIHMNTICKYYSHVYMYIVCKNPLQNKMPSI